jgi:lipopolysaccharide export system permease protein
LTRRPFSLFGLETRYVARLYFMRTLLVTLMVMVLVLALDLAGRFDRVLTAQGLVETPEGALRLAYYLWLRSEYNLPAVLPIALMIGILWVEFSLTRGHERAMIANTGRAPGLSLVPAVLVGLAVGLTQYGLLAHVRPHAVEAQGEAGFRFYGSRFTGGTAPPAWRDFGDTVVRAGIRFGAETPVLVDLRLFAFDADNRLVLVVWSDVARPAAGAMQLEGEYARWPVDPTADDDTAHLLDLAIDPDWLSYAGVQARFLPQPVLSRIAAAETGVPAQWAYRTALHERWAAIAGGVAMALLVASLSLHWVAERRGILRPLLILAAGYTLHLTGNVFSALGEYGLLAPVPAAWSPAAAVLAGCLLALLVNHWRVARRLASLRPDE